MEQIAFIIGDRLIHWSFLMVALGGAVAVCLFLWLYTRQTDNWSGAGWMLLLSCPLSVFFARLIHWYCQYTSYPSFLAAITRPCPITITPRASTTTGCRHPNRRRLVAMFATCRASCVFWFRSYGISSSMGRGVDRPSSSIDRAIRCRSSSFIRNLPPGLNFPPCI